MSSHRIATSDGDCEQLLRQRLAAISESYVLSEKQKRECKQRYVVAFHRGRVREVGDRLAFEEDYWTEFKGMDVDMWNKPTHVWKYHHFMLAMKEFALPSICAFINTALLVEDRPIVPARLMLGVTDEGYVHGVVRNCDLQLHPLQHYEKQLQQELTEWLREQIENRIEDTYTRMKSKMSKAISVEVQALFVPPHLAQSFPNPMVPFLVEIMLDFEMLFLSHPAAIYTTKRANCTEWSVYVRSAKPALLQASKEEVSRLLTSFFQAPDGVTVLYRD